MNFFVDLLNPYDGVGAQGSCLLCGLVHELFPNVLGQFGQVLDFAAHAALATSGKIEENIARFDLEKMQKIT